jgi:hypothetical protein
MATLALLAAIGSLLQPQRPVLEFPEAGLDDPAAYQGYATRFFRDARRNAFQVSVDSRSGRVVHLWADGLNASAAFTARDGSGRPAALRWAGEGAEATLVGQVRLMGHRLSSRSTALRIGWFLLGTMRQERDFQYWQWHRRPYGPPEFVLAEFSALVNSLERLPEAERTRHLALLNAGGLGEVRARLRPRLTLERRDGAWIFGAAQPSLDGRRYLTLSLRVDARRVTARLTGDVLSLTARGEAGIDLEVSVTTDGPALTPLDRSQILNPAFETFHARQRQTADSLRAALPPARRDREAPVVSFRRLEREIRALELLSYQEKLLASMPNYATYFGRDMMMSALMLEPIAAADVPERVIASVLRKLGPEGDVSHEEALGDQAIREAAAEYAREVDAWAMTASRDSVTAGRHLAAARAVLERLDAVRENYRMIDDDFQLSVLVDRYLARGDLPPGRKRRFLAERTAGGPTHLELLVRNLALVAERARPYAADPVATNLVGFLHRDAEGWQPGSWRDSRAGYGNGRFAMDVNVVWVPEALEALSRLSTAIASLGLSLTEAASRLPPERVALRAYLRDPSALSAAAATWRGARRHFEVRLEPVVIRRQLRRWLDGQPAPARAYWRRRVDEDVGPHRPLSFLALALADRGRPVPAVNTDVATELLLEDFTGAVLEGSRDPATVLALLDPITRPYPVGLFVAGLGPVVVNDAYADSVVQRRFREDTYQSPTVVWGREVNLLLLGLGRQIAAGYSAAGTPRNDGASFRAYLAGLREALEVTRAAVEASGLRHNELWSYRIESGRLRPIRYGTSSDIQLWNVTDLAVRFQLEHLPPP